MGAGRDPNGPVATPLTAQRVRLAEQLRRQLDVEFQITRHVHEVLGSAEIAQALRVLGREPSERREPRAAGGTGAAEAV
jgi:hypothetical protein